MSQSVKDDARRKFAFAFTIEGHDVRLWYGGRAEYVASDTFDFMKVWFVNYLGPSVADPWNWAGTEAARRVLSQILLRPDRAVRMGYHDATSMGGAQWRPAAVHHHRTLDRRVPREDVQDSLPSVEHSGRGVARARDPGLARRTLRRGWAPIWGAAGCDQGLLDRSRSRLRGRHHPHDPRGREEAGSSEEDQSQEAKTRRNDIPRRIRPACQLSSHLRNRRRRILD